jgi:hypothetical protein
MPMLQLIRETHSRDSSGILFCFSPTLKPSAKTCKNKKDIADSGKQLQKKIPLIEAEFIGLMFVVYIDVYVFQRLCFRFESLSKTAILHFGISLTVEEIDDES